MSRPHSVPTAVPNLSEERLQALKDLIPEAFSEDRVDFEKLRAALGDLADDRPERYTFSWAGKRDAIRLLQTPTRAALVPAPDESLDFDTTQNIFIEGDNLEALKLLYKPYFGRVKLIYIDPPYNTGNDFIYPDDYADPLGKYLELTGQQDAAGNLLTSNPETSGRYHSAWLSMMYPRLFLARQLLREDGVIFVSIDDHEVHNLRMLMNEVFGEENFVADISVVSNLKGRNDKKHIATAHEHLLVYSKDQFSSLGIPLNDKQLSEYGEIDAEGEAFQWRDLRKRGGADTRNARPNLYFPLYINAETGDVALESKGNFQTKVLPEKSDGTEGCWRWGIDKVSTNLERLHGFKVEGKNKWNISYRVYLQEKGQFRRAKPKSVWFGSEYSTDAATKSLKELIPSPNNLTPKPIDLLKTVMHQSMDEDDVCLDFFAGSATTAHAMLELNRENGGNRRFILIQLPESTGNSEFPTIAEIGKERIRRVIARMKEPKENGSQIALPLETRESPEDLGFRVFKLAPSHFKPWVGVEEKDAQAYAQQMELFRDPLVEGWTVEGVLAELAVKHGFGLDYQVERCAVSPQVEGQPVDFYLVSDRERGQSFYACLAPRLTLEAVESLGLQAEDLFICRDAALDDEAAANLALQCRLETI